MARATGLSPRMTARPEAAFAPLCSVGRDDSTTRRMYRSQTRPSTGFAAARSYEATTSAAVAVLNFGVGFGATAGIGTAEAGAGLESSTVDGTIAATPLATVSSFLAGSST